MVELLELILDKKELRGISREYAQEILDRYLSENPAVKKAFDEDPERFVRKKQFQKVRSDVREVLRKAYGVFFGPQYPAKREPLLLKLKDDPSAENAAGLLAIHRSTSERLDYYDMVFREIFRVTGTPESILDLGCGYNPFAYPYLGCKPAYHSADIARDDLQRIGEFFDTLGITHSEHCVDLSNPKVVKNLPQVDVAFAFKVFDSLEDRNWNVTKELLDLIPAKWIVASFPTKTIGQKKSIRPREWFEKLVTDRVQDVVTLPNEQFFIITGQ